MKIESTEHDINEVTASWEADYDPPILHLEQKHMLGTNDGRFTMHEIVMDESMLRVLIKQLWDYGIIESVTLNDTTEGVE